MRNAGVFLQVVGFPNEFNEINAEIEMATMRVSLRPFLDANRFAILGPCQDIVLGSDGSDFQERFSLQDMKPNSGSNWTSYQVVHFMSEVLKSILLTPFNLILANAHTTQLPMATTDGELYRRLKVCFSNSVFPLSSDQILYFDDQDFLKRHDFGINYSLGSSVARIPSEYQKIQGLWIPTQNEIFVRLPDGSLLPEPLVLSINIQNIKIQMRTKSDEENSK